jgi:hypothetical protein
MVGLSGHQLWPYYLTANRLTIAAFTNGSSYEKTYEEESD